MRRKKNSLKKDLKHAKAKRETMLKKLSNPSDPDDPRWVRAYLGHAEARIARKEKALRHRLTQKKVGTNRRGGAAELDRSISRDSPQGERT